jgi:hypothetical protein
LGSLEGLILMRLLVLSFCVLVTGLAAGQVPPTLGPAGPPPPPLPTPQSLVTTFRELLEMSPEGRARALASKSEQHRKIINQRLDEFDKLPPEQRQVRLRLMQLSAELKPLLTSSPTNRGALLSLIPDEDKQLINERLRYWDQLSPELQKWVFENQIMLGYFLSGQASTPADLSQNIETLPPSVRPAVTNSLAAFRRLSPDQQQKVFHDFIEVFGLDEKERDKIIAQSLIQGQENERKQIERLVVSFQKLPRAQQEQCMESLRKFTSMNISQRAQFLQKAERWDKMPEADKQAWRTLVGKVPPLPPSASLAQFFGSPHQSLFGYQSEHSLTPWHDRENRSYDLLMT